MTNKNTNIQYKIIVLLIMMMMGAGSAWAQEKSVWDGTEAAKIEEGAGTKDNPYIIKTAAEFAYFAKNMNSKTWYVKLKAGIEIDLDGVVDSDGDGKTNEWTYGKNNWTFKGHFDGNGSTISNMKIETNGANKSFGLFPQLTGSSVTNHAEIKNLILKDCQINTPNSATGYGATTNVGILLGKTGGNADIENVTLSGGSIAYEVTTTGANYVGCLAGNVSSDNCTVKNCTVSGISVTTSTALKKDFYVGGLAGNVGTNAVIYGNTVSSFTVTLDGNTSGSNVIGGLIGKAAGTNSTASAALPMGKRSWVQKNIVKKSAISMNGSVETANLEIGGLIGWVGNHVNVFNNKVDSTAIAIKNNINANSYVGGAVGYLDKQAFIDGMTVCGTGSITGPTSDKTVKNNVVFFVGGYLGYQNSSAATNFDANKFKNIAVTGMNINLGHYVPAGQIKDHKFSVGGIAGSVNAPNMKADGTWGGMPENLIFKGGKIYAPWASTSPIVGNFNAAAATHQNMTLDQVTTVDAIEMAKAKTWYYNDYKLGLSSGFLNSTSVTEQNAAPAHLKFRKNYSKATETIDGIQYLSIDNSTLTRYNRYQDSERDLKTVLWWTQQASKDNSKTPPTVAAVTCFTANEQPIYPQSGATSAQAGDLVDYPYYMYFFQGVGHAKYASNTDAENIAKGIEANVTNDVMPAVAMASEDNLNVTITNEGETRRGFDERTLSVTVNEGNTDVTSNYTYQWYLDGKADGTGTTKKLTPHWKDGQGVTVNVLSGSTIVATTSYGFAPGMLHTKASAASATAELIRSDYINRGTSTNPYVIDCESALRQLSYLSTVHTSMFWETLGKPASPYPTNQSQGHYDRAYYVLTNDIDLGNREFTPISHVGYGGDGSWGTYTTNFIFQGVFDGQAHKISNFRITWGASQYNGNNINLYYGLFGCVGNGTAARKWGDDDNRNTVIKNLIIDGATLTHNTAETSFYYDQNISTNSNNCMVGILAGIVSSNTTVQNIEIRNSTITDAGSQDYSLATKGLYVGGAIGSMQHAYGTTNTAMTNTQIQHIAAQVDITLTHPTFVSVTTHSQVGQFNIGGIIGRYIATSATQDQAQSVMPAYTIYSGTVNAPKAWISPVLAALRYASQQGTSDWKNFSKQWEGNNNSDATQITITNALFYNFYIGSTKITDKVPGNGCELGSRSMQPHANAADTEKGYSALKYQGVNYGARYIDIVGASLEHMNVNQSDSYNWVWADGFVHMTTDPLLEAHISRDGNIFTASLVGGEATGCRWEVSFDSENWIKIPDATAYTYTANPSLKPKQIVAHVYAGETTYRTSIEDVAEDKSLIDPIVTKNDNTYTFNLQSTAPAGQLVTTYQWYENKTTPFSPAVIDRGLTLNDAQMTATGGIVWCKVLVTELGVKMYEDMLIAGATVVYVDPVGGTDNDGDSKERGWTRETAVKTLDHANSLLKTPAEGGTMESNIIVIKGMLNNGAAFKSNGRNPATISGKWNNSDANTGIINLIKTAETGANPGDGTNNGFHNYVSADTKFENIKFHPGGTNDNFDNIFIECHGHDVWFGKGIRMDTFRNLSPNHGNLTEDSQTVPELSIILTASNHRNPGGLYNSTKPQVLTIESGHYGRILGGRYTSAFFKRDDNDSHSILGSADQPAWAVINIDIDKDNDMKSYDDGMTTYTCDVNCIVAGLTDGTVFGDYTINIKGGDVRYIVGANQGNGVANGTATYTPAGGTSGAYGQWPNSSFFGRTVINIDQNEDSKSIALANVYAGGLGRYADAIAAVVDMYIYGHTEVNVKSGDITGSLYGGGAGGVLGRNPWDAHVPYQTDVAGTVPAQAIINGVQYGDNRVTDHWSNINPTTATMAKVKLHNLQEDGTYSEEILDLANSSTTINISGGTIGGSVYGGGDGYVSNLPAELTMQGVGSVFGTTNINITGGTVVGNVYGGSRGSEKYFRSSVKGSKDQSQTYDKNVYGQVITHIAEMNGPVNINITGTDEKYPTITGNIYGGGQGIPTQERKATQADVDARAATSVGETYTEEYSRIATTGNSDLGYNTNINILIDLPEKQIFTGNIYGGGQMGLVDGNTNVIIKGGSFIGNIFGGGAGENNHLSKAKVTGNTHVLMDNSYQGTTSHQQIISGNIYGGGEISHVAGNTKVHIRSGNVEGNVFGAGQGKADQPEAAAVTGKTQVIIGEE